MFEHIQLCDLNQRFEHQLRNDCEYMKEFVITLICSTSEVYLNSKDFLFERLDLKTKNFIPCPFK